MTQVVALLVVFLGCVFVLVGAFLFVNRRSLALAEAALDRLTPADERAELISQGILKDSKVSDLPTLDRLLSGKAVTSWLTRQLEAAGSSMTAGRFLLQATLVSAVVGMLVALLTSSILATLVATLGTAVASVLWIVRRVSRRMARFREQLPDAIDMLVNAMKAGYSFQAAMKFIGDEVPEPLGPIFGRFYEEQRLGLEVRTALLSLQARIPSAELKMLVTAILIQRETGGNLSEVLGKIASLMRERMALKGEVETMTAESKMSARILALLPVVVFLMMTLVNPDFNKPMLDASWGPLLLFGSACSVGLGYYWMMSIADIDL